MRFEPDFEKVYHIEGAAYPKLSTRDEKKLRDLKKASRLELQRLTKQIDQINGQDYITEAEISEVLNKIVFNEILEETFSMSRKINDPYGVLP